MAPKTKSVPQPKQDRAKDTVQLVIDATNRAIEGGGESSVRIQELSAQTGVSIGSIYHHFGDRDLDEGRAGLVDDGGRDQRILRGGEAQVAQRREIGDHHHPAIARSRVLKPDCRRHAQVRMARCRQSGKTYHKANRPPQRWVVHPYWFSRPRGRGSGWILGHAVNRW